MTFIGPKGQAKHWPKSRGRAEYYGDTVMNIILAAAIIWSLTISYSESSEKKDIKKPITQDLTLQFADGSKLTYDTITDECTKAILQYSGKKFKSKEEASETITTYLYEKLFAKKKIFNLENKKTEDHKKFATFCLNAEENLPLACAKVFFKVCKLKEQEPEFQQEMQQVLEAQGIKLVGEFGSMTVPKMTRSKKNILPGKLDYTSRSGKRQSISDISGIVNLPKNPPTGKGITIGFHEEGIDPSHHMVSESIESEKKESLGKSQQNPTHGTAVVSVFGQIAPASKIQVITSVDLGERPANAILKDLYPQNKNEKQDEYEKRLSNLNLNDHQIKTWYEEVDMPLNKLAGNPDALDKVFNNISILNVSRTIDRKERINEELKSIQDGAFKTPTTGKPYLLSVLAKNRKMLIVKGAGNKPEPTIDALDEFAVNNAGRRMIVVGSIAIADGKEVRVPHNYATCSQDMFICAPGWSILVAVPGEGQEHGVSKGTSLAAPIVSGALALLMEKYPQWKDTPETYIKLLLDSARRETWDGDTKEAREKNYQERFGQTCGRGILDISSALDLADKLEKAEEEAH